MDDGAGTGEQMRWLADVVVVPKAGVNDPEGEAILGGLRQLGYDGVEGVQAGRLFVVSLRATNLDAAETAVRAMCDRLLANPVIESYRLSVKQTPGEVQSASGRGAAPA